MLNIQEKIKLWLGKLFVVSILFWIMPTDAYQETSSQLLDQLSSEAANTNVSNHNVLPIEASSEFANPENLNTTIDMNAVINRIQDHIVKESHTKTAIKNQDLEALVHNALKAVQASEIAQKKQSTMSSEFINKNMKAIVNQVLMDLDLETDDERLGVFTQLENEATVLVQKKVADPPIKRSSTDSCLFDKIMVQAVKEKNIDYLQLCFDKGFLIDTPNPDSGISLLHLAASQGLSSVVTFLLEHRANINAQENLDRTPLFYAVATRQRAIIKLLLDKGADQSIRDSLGFKPIDRVTTTELRHLLQFHKTTHPNK